MPLLKGKKIGFIGAGNMASAIIQGLINSGLIEKQNIFVSDLDNKKLEDMRERGVVTCTENKLVVDKSDIIILAVKPDTYEKILKEICTISNVPQKIFVSIAPGISISYIKKFFSINVKVVRAMPNTPALVGEGMTVTCYEPPVLPQEFEEVNEIFRSIGKVEAMQEDYLNEVVSVNGSSPAYVYMMIEAMADAAVLRGVPRDVAYRLVSQSILGSAKMVLSTGLHPGQLKDMVCSPGGTTIQAVYELEKSGFRASLINAMEKCTEKAMDLSRKYIKN